MTFVSAVLSNSFKSRIASLFSMNLSRLFHCSVIKVLCLLPFSNFYILSDVQALVNNFFYFSLLPSQATAILDYHRQSSLSTTFFLLSEVFSRSAVASHAACVLTFLLSMPPHQRQLAYNSTAHGRSQHILAAFSKVGHLPFFIVIA